MDMMISDPFMPPLKNQVIVNRKAPVKMYNPK